LNLSSNQKLVTGEVYHPYFSTFGLSSTTISNHFKGYIGYDGNQVLYISDVPDKKNGTKGYIDDCENLNPEKEKSVYASEYAIGDTGFCEAYGNYENTMYFRLFLTEIGAGQCQFVPGGCMIPKSMSVCVNTSNAPASEQTDLAEKSMYSIGYNVTCLTHKALNERVDISTLLLSGVSIALSSFPVASAGFTILGAGLTAGSLLCCLTNSKSTQATDNQKAEQIFCVTGGNRNSGSSYNDYLFGTCSLITISNGELINHDFAICVTYNTYYCGVNCNHNGLATTMKQKISSAPSSVVTGNITSSTSQDSFYIINPDNGHSYRLITGNGLYYFYAKPDSPYNVYARSPKGI
jgi:hypothetical protein